MKFIHYTSKKFSLEPREYDQKEMAWQAKPNGLWFSVEGDYDWKSWCEDANFMVQDLVFAYEIILKEGANIVHLKTAEEIFNFGKEYPYLEQKQKDFIGRDVCRTYELDWVKVKCKYQGIVISPYQWECRLSPESNWYYGWDCASGCIWDLECIEEFKLRENNE
jgi:hypothetical protein